jgi:hypothetical protein
VSRKPVNSGHAAIENTLNIYIHAIPETRRHAIGDLEPALSPRVRKLPGAEAAPVC